MLAKTPDPLDVMVGAKIRIFRTHRGMSQSDLAGKIGVTFQQVQKYEKGINRVGASRLSRIAAVLGISIGELFEPSEDKSAGSKSPFRLLAERDALRVLKAFSRTSDPRVRRAIAQLVESVADQQPPAKSSTVRPAAAKRRERRPRTSGTQA
jgi:transcriptional regulator with XRE-family HTH domain